MSDPQTRSGIARSTALHLALVLLLGLAAYSNSFRVPFVFDDMPNITENPLISDLSNIPALFAGAKGPFASRPLMHATFALNYHFGGFDPTGYHAVNLALHLINATLLYFLMLLTGRHLGYGEGNNRMAAFVSSLLLTIHPALTEGVLFAVSRSVLFATTFYLLGTLLFLKAVTSKTDRAIYVTGLFLVSMLGMSSREDFATFPFMLVIYDMLFISRMKPKEALGHWKVYLPVFLSLAYMAHLVLNNTYDRSADFAGVGVEAHDYLLTQFNVHWTYLRLLVLPINQTIDYDYPISHMLLEIPTVLSFLGYVALWAGALAFARKRPVVAFPILWFLIILLPISFAVSLLGLRLDDVLLEHRLYLPAAGLFVIPGIAASLSYEKLRTTGLKSAAVLTAVLVVLTLAGGTFARTSIWRDRISIWQDAIAKAPGKARPYLNLGVVYASQGMNREAIEEFQQASKRAGSDLFIYNQLAGTYSQMGGVYLSMGLTERAIDNYQMAISLWPRDGRLHIGAAKAYIAGGNYEKAIEQLNTALAMKPEPSAAKEYYVSIHRGLAMAYRKKGLPDRAAEHSHIAEDLLTK